MYKAVASLQLPSGDFAEVGMTSRCILGPFKNLNYIYKQAAIYRDINNNPAVRIEIFSADNIYGAPFDILILER